MKFWIARDDFAGDYELNLFDAKPIRGEHVWMTQEPDDVCFSIDSELFPEITWEDEPRIIEINLIN